MTATAERRALARARWVLTAQLAGAISAVVLLVGMLVLFMTVDGQRRDSERELRFDMRHGSFANPPPCVWLFAQDGAHTSNAPPALPLRSDLARVASTGRPLLGRHTISGLPYLIITERHGGIVVQGVMDLRYQQRDQRRLVIALILTESAGLLAALVTGQLLARRAISPLAEALHRRTRFVADASHELRTPLTRLHVRAQLLARRARGDGVDDELRTIVSDTRQFGEVIEDLLRSAEFQPESAGAVRVDLGAVAASVVEAEAARARANEVTLELIPPSPPEFVVNGVEAALRRVVGGLVDNALGHTEPGGHIEVILGRAEKGRCVELTVRDDGAGFHPDHTELIFHRSTHGANGKGRRFGLGLALVREIVEHHGGRITAVGEPGRGALFTVLLPAADDVRSPKTEAAPAETTRPAGHEPGSHEPGSHETAPARQLDRLVRQAFPARRTASGARVSRSPRAGSFDRLRARRRGGPGHLR